MFDCKRRQTVENREFVAGFAVEYRVGEYTGLYSAEH